MDPERVGRRSGKKGKEKREQRKREVRRKERREEEGNRQRGMKDTWTHTHTQTLGTVPTCVFHRRPAAAAYVNLLTQLSAATAERRQYTAELSFIICQQQAFTSISIFSM